MTTATKRDIFATITDRIVAAIEGTGKLPWRKPWQGVGGRPQNAITGRAYNGVNVLLLGMLSPFASPYWATFRQWQGKKAKIIKGSKGTHILFWKMISKVEREDDGTETERRFWLARSYVVFNAEQVEGWTPPAAAGEDRTEPEKIEDAEAILADWIERGPSLRHVRGDRAFYRPASDEIVLPERDQFASADGYYRTAFHESTHSTGHASRLDRFEKTGNPAPFGSESYAEEELVAEIGSAFLCATVGLDGEEVENSSAAYVKGWLRRLRDDPKLVVHAASKAEKAVSLIMGGTEEEEGEDD